MARKVCAFSEGSTTPAGKKQAPDQCRKAILEKFKKVIEKCEIEHEHECPLRAFVEAEREVK
jgi:hypothetical protein